MSVKAHRWKKALFKAFSFATYNGWSVFVVNGTAVRLRLSRWNEMAKTGFGLFYLVNNLLHNSFEVYQIPHMGKYFHVDHARRTCITAYPNMVTKPQRYAKSRDLQEKNESKNEGLLCYVKNIATFSWVFCKAFNGKTQENLRTVYNLFDHWNMALSSDFRHLKTLSLPLDRSSICFEDGSLLLALCSSTKCCCVKAESAKNLRHCYVSLSNSCWTIFLGSSPMSLPFSLTLCCTTAWNNSVDLPCGPSIIYVWQLESLTPLTADVSKDYTAARQWLDPSYIFETTF